MKVKIAKVNTKPEYDPYINLPGKASYTNLFLSPTKRTVWVNQQYEINSTLITVWNGVVLQTRVTGHPDEEELKQYLEKGRGQELLRVVCKGHGVEWDGNNIVGYMTEEASEAWRELKQTLGAYWESKYSFWNADDYLTWGADESVEGNMTNEEIKSLAEEFEAHTEEEGIVLDEDVYDWLVDYRDSLLQGEE